MQNNSYSEYEKLYVSILFLFLSNTASDLTFEWFSKTLECALTKIKIDLKERYISRLISCIFQAKKVL